MTTKKRGPGNQGPYIEIQDQLDSNVWHEARRSTGELLPLDGIERLWPGTKYRIIDGETIGEAMVAGKRGPGNPRRGQNKPLDIRLTPENLAELRRRQEELAAQGVKGQRLSNSSVVNEWGDKVREGRE